MCGQRIYIQMNINAQQQHLYSTDNKHPISLRQLCVSGLGKGVQ